MNNIKERLAWSLNYCLGRIRIYFGRCPLCNSDAPDLYNCACCNFYSSASGDPFPPKLETKNEWWNTYKSVIDCQLKLSVSIKESKNHRLKNLKVERGSDDEFPSL